VVRKTSRKNNRKKKRNIISIKKNVELIVLSTSLKSRLVFFLDKPSSLPLGKDDRDSETESQTQDESKFYDYGCELLPIS
jgi:hypothetical protein